MSSIIFKRIFLFLPFMLSAFSGFSYQGKLFKQDIVSFTIPKGWTIYKNVTNGSGVHQVSIKPDVQFSNTTIIIIWFCGEVNLMQYLVNAQKRHKVSTQQAFRYDNITNGYFNKYNALINKYFATFNQIEMVSTNFAFHSNGRTFVVIKTESVDEKIKYKSDFDLIESSFNISTKITSIQKPHCDNIVKIADIEICLPLIDGFVECIDYTKVNEFAKSQELDGTITLGLYLNYETINNLDKLFIDVVDDYFKIMIPDTFYNIYAEVSDFEMAVKVFESIYNDDHIIRETIKNFADNLTIDKPIVIAQYSPHSLAETFVQLIKFREDNNEWIGVSVLSIILLRNKILFLGYYKNYNEPNDIQTARSKNDYMIQKIFSTN